MNKEICSISFGHNITYDSIDKFLKSLKIKYSDELAYHYNRKIANATSFDAPSVFTYERTQNYLKSSSNVFGSVAGLFHEKDLTNEETFQGMVEAATLASLTEFGKPNWLIAHGEKFYLLNSEDFVLAYHFDNLGQMYRGLECRNTVSNFAIRFNPKVLADFASFTDRKESK